MKENNKELISKSTREKLCSLYSDLPVEQEILVDRIKDEILKNISRYAKMTDFNEPVKKVDTLFFKRVANYSENDQAVLRCALVAKLALHLPAIVNKLNLPESIILLYPDAFDRLAEFLNITCTQPYDSTTEFFCKDVRFVLGLSIPNGAIITDMFSHVSIFSVILSLFRTRRISGIIKYASVKGIGSWFRGHIDSRYLTDVNERGFDNAFCRTAELLLRKNDVRGYVGTSWLHDPPLSFVSPHLAYFQKWPREGGAFLLRHATEHSDIESAIRTSKTRRQLFQEGKYIPVCYSMLWPRDKLIAWAKQVTKSSTHD